MGEAVEEDPNEDEPLAEADAAECEAVADLCEITVGAREGKADDAETSMRLEIFEAFSPQPIIMVPSTHDGMPVPSDERSDLAVAHPFTRETLVCLEDDTSYVELFGDELASRGWVMLSEGSDAWAAAGQPVDFTRWTHVMRPSVSSRYDADGATRPRRTFSPEAVKNLFGVFVATADGAVYAVRPKRERCQHFMRQIMANDDVPDPAEYGHFIRFYNCTARKSVGGAYMTLRDEAVYACDYRSPPDHDTAEKYLDAYDRKRLSEKRHLELIRPFNLR